jgi:hypothetical protein
VAVALFVGYDPMGNRCRGCRCARAAFCLCQSLAVALCTRAGRAAVFAFSVLPAMAALALTAHRRGVRAGAGAGRGVGRQQLHVSFGADLPVNHADRLRSRC